MPGTVLSSNEISGMIGSFGGISSMAANPFAEQAMGGMMTRLGGSLGPMLQGGMGMLGLDPMSLGLKAGMGAFNAGAGLGAAGAVGLGTAAAVGIPMMAAGYMGNQAFIGMQQQQQLNNTLRQNFNHMGPNGQGFNRSQMGDIGSMMREMTHQFGPGGEIASYRELTAMAGQMGQMGMARGVRDVQEFSKKFKEMVDAAKTMARDLGTTLEGAVQTMQSLRNSGVFKVTDQVKFTGAARNTALTGNLAMTEVNAMASIGAQISRSVGGLGRQGAFGGMRAIGQIGAAQMAGTISEEDIYNSTGLTGAEGRQAYATRMLSQDADFLKGGRGRRLLAALATKDGQLDTGAISEFMSGGMTVGRTMELDDRMKQNVGRANFIRNEGRLRGEFLEKFGGMAKVMGYSQWASGKGIDITDLSNDRNVLAGMRWTGMGRDEYETAIKMMQNMPNMALQQANTARDDEYFRNRADYQKTQGIQGLQTKFNQAREKVNGQLQATGAKILEQGSDMVEGWFNRLMGEYVQQTSAKASAAYDAAVKGDRSGFERAFGGGGSIVKGNDVGGSYASGGMFNGFMGKGLMNFNDRKSIFEKRGYSFDSVGDESDLRDKLDTIAKMQGAAGANVDKSDVANAAALGGKMTDFFAYQAGKGGEDTLNRFSDMLSTEAQKGNGNAKALLLRMRQSPTEAARVLHAASVASGGEFDEASKLMGVGAVDPNNVFMQEGGKFRSEGERRDAYFQAFTGEKRARAFTRMAAATGGIGGAVSAFVAAGGFATMGYSLSAAAGGYAAGSLAKEELDKNDALSAELSSGHYNDLINDAYSSDPKRRAEAQAKIQNDSRKLNGMEDNASLARRQILASIDATSTFAALGEAGTDEEAAEIIKSKGLGEAFDTWSKKTGMASEADFLRQRGATLKSGVDDDQLAARIQQAGLVKAQGKKELESMLQGGFASMGADGKLTLSASTQKAMAGLDPKTQALMQQMVSVAEAKSGTDQKSLAGTMMQEASMFENLRNMSVEEQRKAASALRASGQGRMAAVLEAEASTSQRIKKSLDKKGVVGGIAAELGLEIDPERKKAIEEAQKKGDYAKASQLLYSELDGAGLGKGVSAGKLEQALQHGKLQGSSVADATKVIKSIQESEEFQQGKKDKAKKADEEKNPLMAEVRDLLKNIKDSSEAVMKSSKLTASNTGDLLSKKEPGDKM